MNCRTCQYELSQCLDGRLASGRRALVMDHVAACDGCAGFWRELQAAQTLVVRLAPKHVGADFRNQLFERIQTGEGTPPAVFREPVPFCTKLRYTLTGAAAAAAVLIAATLVRNGTATPSRGATTNLASVDDTPMPATTTSSAPTRATLAADYQPSPDSSPLVRRGDTVFNSVRPLTPDLVAVETAREFEQRFEWTTRLLDRGANDDATARTVCANGAEIHSLGRVLVDLRDSKWVTFGDPKVDADLRVIVTLLDDAHLRDDGRFERDDGLEIARTRVASALRNSPNLAQLTSTLRIAPTFDRDAQQQAMLRFARSWSGVLDRIFFVLPSDAGAGDFDPRDLSRMFVFQDACGPIYVAPRLRR